MRCLNTYGYSYIFSHYSCIINLYLTCVTVPTLMSFVSVRIYPFVCVRIPSHFELLLNLDKTAAGSAFAEQNLHEHLPKVSSQHVLISKENL